MVEGKPLCPGAFTAVLGISKKRYKRLRDSFSSGAIQFTRKSIRRSEAVKVSEAKAWMARFFEEIGDHMPNSNQTHLPHFLTKKDVHERMRRDLLEEGVHDTVSLSYFYSIWSKSFKNVVIPEVLLQTYCN